MSVDENVREVRAETIPIGARLWVSPRTAPAGWLGPRITSVILRDGVVTVRTENGGRTEYPVSSLVAIVEDAS